MTDSSEKLRVAVIGLGKMGLSHVSMLRPDPRVDVVGICDASKLLRDIVHKYTGLQTFSDAKFMLSAVDAEAVVIATPTTSHAALAKNAIDSGASVFCEKPLTLAPDESARLADLTARSQVYGQVGYHNRFVASFQEAKRLLVAGAIGRVTHVRAEAHGPVVLKPSGNTWRTRRTQGGGCLYDYAAHPIDLATWFLGATQSVAGTVLQRTFSEQAEDEVYATLRFPNDTSAQLSVNWSDESQRKMRTALTLWGTNGTIYADRQECRVYLRGPDVPQGYQMGWNIRYTTDLTPPVGFYVRGEEYSAQLHHFVTSALATRDGLAVDSEPASTFATATYTDQAIDMLLRDHASSHRTTKPPSVDPATDGATYIPSNGITRPRMLATVKKALRR